jgi:hypothetical protein
VKNGVATCERQPRWVVAEAAGETSGGQMADVVLIGIVVLIFFAVGFTVGVLIVGLIGRWRNGRQRRDADLKSEHRP